MARSKPRFNPTTPRGPRPRDYGLFEVLDKGAGPGYVESPPTTSSPKLAHEPHAWFEFYVQAINEAARLRETTGTLYYVRRLGDHPPAKDGDDHE